MRWHPDWFVVGIIAAMVAGLVVEISAATRDLFSLIADLSVCLIFLVYGMRLRTSEVTAGLRNVKLQGLVLGCTYLLFPILGWALSFSVQPWLGEGFAHGFLYLALLPSTIQSSVTFVSIARGNVAAAVCSATVSNILGMFITPLLVLLFLNIGGASSGGLTSVVTKLLLPFISGQILQPWVGSWWRAHKTLVKRMDNGSIILIVFSAVLNATAEGAWKGVTVWTLVILVMLCGVLLAAMLAGTWWIAGRCGMQRDDRIVVLMCGSKKSLASGLPMAKALFPASIVGALIVPVVVFHQMQIFTCAIIANRLSRA